MTGTVQTTWKAWKYVIPELLVLFSLLPIILLPPARKTSERL
jgi:hypothetical protein